MNELENALVESPQVFKDGVVTSLYKIYGQSITSLGSDEKKIMSMMHLIVLKRMIGKRDTSEAYMNVMDDVMVILKTIKEKKETLAQI
tara:strand:+ start:234 stop:497 length:264 start_codon:yes stop_codon:yes gene_type:complete